MLGEYDAGYENYIDSMIGQMENMQFCINQLKNENIKLRELITFYLGCLTKGHVNCDSCAFSGEDNCDHGRKVIESAKQIGIEVD